MQPSKFTLDLKLHKNYLLLVKSGKSPEVKVGFLNWSIHASTKEDRVATKFLSVVLHCNVDNDPVRHVDWECETDYTIIIKNQKGQPDHVRPIGKREFSSRKPLDGVACFYQVQRLESQGFIDDNDQIHIQIEVTPGTTSGNYFQKMKIQEEFAFKGSSASSLTILHLLKSGEGSNLTIVSRDKAEFKAHRGILAMKSEVFATMMEADMAEAKTGLIRMEKDMDGASVKAFLRFLYLGDFSLVNQCTLTQVKQLVNAGEKYGFPKLKKYCGIILVENCDVQNAAELYKFAQQFKILEAQTAIFTFAQTNFQLFWHQVVSKVELDVSYCLDPSEPEAKKEMDVDPANH